MGNDFGVRYKFNLQHLEEDDVRALGQLFGNKTKRNRFVAGENRGVRESSIKRHTRSFCVDIAQ